MEARKLGKIAIEWEIRTSVSGKVALDVSEELNERKAFNVVAEDIFEVGTVRLVDLNICGHLSYRAWGVRMRWWWYSGK
jgi:hypothetical protein